MKKLNPPMIAAIGTIAIIIALLVSLYLSGVAYKVPDDLVSLSDERSPADKEMLEQNLKIAGEVDINSSNVKRVIQTLARPEAYKANVTNTLYYDDTYGSVSCVQSVINNAYRVDYLKNNGETEYSQIIYDNMCYAFTPNSQEYNSFNLGNFSANSSAMIPSYQTILDLPDSSITGSRMFEESGQMIIEIDTQIDKSIGIYRISLKNGLLYSADFSENGKMIRKVQIDIKNELPSSDEFILAGDTKPIYEKSEN